MRLPRQKRRNEAGAKKLGADASPGKEGGYGGAERDSKIVNRGTCQRLVGEGDTKPTAQTPAIAALPPTMRRTT
ncbi:hypothetical protein C1880_07980 [Senegalimassilia anaerobia]|uniref:Uncharacterized protein n=1 Tax=Senegalimassilia anaerobia TaxID=1473216 RepID=A0A369L5N3_9ACTN|nr:hypothetical protein C1880_07980 [Senegalimassilia anaerobia]